MHDFSFPDDEQAMSEINMIPFIDVMLVLLIVFIITVPVIHHAVNLDLPRASNTPEDVKPESIDVSVLADGAYLWQGEVIDDAGLEAALAQASHADPVPELHLRADRDVRYERVAQLMAMAQQAGLGKIAFVTEPQAAATGAPAPTTARPPHRRGDEAGWGRRDRNPH